MSFGNCFLNNKVSFKEKENNIINIINKSKYKILNYKSDLYKLYEIIYDFCSNNEIIITNYNINLAKLDNKVYNLLDLNKDFEFNLLSTDPYKYGIEISNLLYKKYSKYVVMSSYLSNKEIIIAIDNNKLIKIQMFFIFNDQKNSNNIHLDKIITDIDFLYSLESKKQFNLTYTDDLFELMQLSHKLYNPTNFLKYIKENKQQLNKKTDINIESNNYIFSKLISGFLESDIIYKIYNEYKESFITNIRKNLINNIIAETSSDFKCVLLDNYAIEFLLSDKNKNINNFNYNNILHIIINSQYVNLIKNIINNFIKQNNNNNEENTIIIKTNSIYIINDFRFKRISFQLLNKLTGKKQTLLYLYVNLDYELIPTILNIKNIYIPHPFVLIRFLIINLYYIQLFDHSYGNQTYKYFLSKLKNILTILDSINNSAILPDKKYKSINYLGIFIDERIDKFKLGSSTYRPWQYKKKNNHLLTNKN